MIVNSRQAQSTKEKYKIGDNPGGLGGVFMPVIHATSADLDFI